MRAAGVSWLPPVRGRRGLFPFVRNLLKRGQAGGLDDMREAGTFVKLEAIPVDDDGIPKLGREPPELRVDQSEAPHHVVDVLVRAVAELDVLLDRVRAR